MLLLDNLTYGTPHGKILARDVQLKMQAGELLFITGANGAGKSTLLRVLVGQMPAVSGAFRWDVSRKEIAYLPQLQQAAFHIPMTLWDVLRISHKGSLKEGAVLRWGLLEKEQLRLAWNTASGGEKKRTLLTRALLHNPRVLILDEPLNHLDRKSREQVSQVLDDFMSMDGKRSIVLVSHDLPDFSGRFPVLRYHLQTVTAKGAGEEAEHD